MSASVQQVTPNIDTTKYAKVDYGLDLIPGNGASFPASVGYTDIVTDAHLYVSKAPTSISSGAAISGSTQITFQLFQGIIPSLLDYAQIRYVLSENGTGSCAVADVFSQINNIQLFTSGGSQLLQTIYSYQLRLAALSFFTPAQIQMLNFGNQLSLDTTTYRSSPLVIAKGGSRNQVLPLVGTCIDESILTKLSQGPIQIVVNFANSGVVTSGTGIPYLSPSSFIDLITKSNPVIDPKRNDFLAKNPIYINPFVQPYTFPASFTVVPGTRNVIAVNGIPDRVFCMMSVFLLASNSNVNDAATNYVALGDGTAQDEANAYINLLDQSLSPMLGGSDIQCSHIRGPALLESVGMNSSLFTTVQPVYHIPIGDRVAKSIINGTSGGGLRLQGTINVALVTPAGFNGGSSLNCTVYVTLWQYFGVMQNFQTGDYRLASS